MTNDDQAPEETAPLSAGAPAEPAAAEPAEPAEPAATETAEPDVTGRPPVRRRVRDRFARTPRWARGIAAGVVALALLLGFGAGGYTLGEGGHGGGDGQDRGASHGQTHDERSQDTGRSGHDDQSDQSDQSDHSDQSSRDDTGSEDGQ